jgi:hypothetical protein
MNKLSLSVLVWSNRTISGEIVLKLASISKDDDDKLKVIAFRFE